MYPPRRIVSLLPGATELLCVLGAADRLVAISHECDFPPEIQHLPRVTRPRIDPLASSAEIDRQTRALVEAGEPLFQLDVARLENLRPDLIVTQAQCDVCAIGQEDVQRLLVGSPFLCRVPTVALEATRLIDFFDDVQRLADAVGNSKQGSALRATWHARIQRTRRLVERCLPRRTLCLEWLEPPILAGNWMPELVELAGGLYPGLGPGKPSRVVDWEALVAWRPQVVVLMPCGFSLDRTCRELNRLRTPLPAQLLSDSSIYAVDGNAYFNRMGPRLVDSLELLAHLLHPEVDELAEAAPRHAIRRLAV